MTKVKLEKSHLRLAAGILISLISMVVLFWYVDGQQVLFALKQVNFIWILPVLILLFVSLITRAAAWRLILQKKVSLAKSFWIINAGYFVNTIFPFRIGEVTRAFLLIPSGFSFWEALPSILLERMFDVVFAVSLFLIGLAFVLNFTQGILYAALLGFLVVMGFVFLYLLVKNQNRVLNWLEKLKLPWTKFQTWLIKRLRSILSGMIVLTDSGQLLRVFTIMVLSWGIAILYQYFLLLAFIPDAQLIWAIFALGTLGVGVSVPSSPGSIGLYEASITLALTAFGIDRSVAFTYALASHILSLGMTALFGSFALIREGYALRDIWQFSQQQKKEKN
ncbi:MAG: flippase-like domain-containing protein [Anaerolineales bacterium]|nr:flippase-like domain-containing protein [Anaerolineales bacterium]